MNASNAHHHRRRARTAPIAFVLAGAWALVGLRAQAAEKSAVFDLSDRAPISVAIVAPHGDMKTMTQADLLRRVAKTLEERTDLGVDPVSAQALSDCRGRLSCMVRRVRSDFDLAKGARSPGDERPRRTPYLLVISALPAEDGDYLSVAMIDTDIALEVLRKEGGAQGSGSDQTIEQRITDLALVSPEEHAEVRDAASATEFFARLLRERFRSRLERDRHWEPFAEIEISKAVPGSTVRFDQKVVGVAGESAVRLIGVAPGRHQVTLEHAELEPFDAAVVAERGNTAAVIAQMSPKPGKFRGERQVVLWSGVGVAAAGTAIFAYGLAASGADVNCWSGQPCPSSFRRLGSPSSPAPLENPNGGGLPIAPLGYSLAGAGATAALAAIFSGDDERPWIPILLGLGVGASAFALSAVLDHTNAVEAAQPKR